MGEAKRRQQAKTPYQIALERMQLEFADKGMIIESGWLGLRAMWVPPDAPEAQVRDMRWAYMAGAQHLFSTIMTILEPGDEPTDADMKRMDLIAKELDTFAAEVKLYTSKAEGSA